MERGFLRFLIIVVSCSDLLFQLDSGNNEQ